ncbi:hypothetical protein RN001_008874 [Aquatica leii]|uniref:THAP-type domain-containing protein n=1 Tax=Aquatica leii TaxID=1421715 RepID=A0AAN7QJA4_9COLE|nr:hypothetical protein RN001_008874 [Aquatica leii]
MEKVPTPVDKYCIVPRCKNTIKSASDKVFFPVPKDAELRKHWCKVIRRDEVSPTSCLHCCEDHFNIISPHIFLRQKGNVLPTVQRMGAIKRQRLSLVKEVLSGFTAKNDVLETSKQPETQYYEI